MPVDEVFPIQNVLLRFLCVVVSERIIQGQDKLDLAQGTNLNISSQRFT